MPGGTQKDNNQKNIADGFGKHLHAQHGNCFCAHHHRDIEQEGQKNIQPDIPEGPVFCFLLKVQCADNGSEGGKGDIAQDTPEKRTAVFQPSVLREQAQEDTKSREGIHRDGDGAFFLYPEAAEPDDIQQDIENGHGHGSDQLADSQGSGEVCADKRMEDAGNKMESIAASKNQGCKAHLLFGSVSCPAQDDDSAGDGKDQIKEIKRGFAEF